MSGTYLDNVLDLKVLTQPAEPIPTQHREGTGEPAADASDPADASPACNSGGFSSVLASWRKVGGGATATLDLKVLLWDPVSEEWNHGDSITGVSPGQLVSIPTGGCRFYVKILGVTDVTGISSWQILLRPWS